jgi:predicted TIM-barrel fold metal-dependent hydrolase
VTDTAVSPSTAGALVGDRYVVISADCHAGATIPAYREYLDAAYRDDFDAWAASFVNPFVDLNGVDADRNWNSDRRLRELEDDGIVAEVVFPNTVPPFFPRSSLTAAPPTAEEFARRWAGLQAHNRWLADFCAEAPGRRAGVAQILLNDADAAVAEIEWAATHGLFGGVLLPGVPPGCGLPPLFAPDYEPIWQACAANGMTLNHHSGSAVPDLGAYPASGAAFIVEITWFAHRALWHLLLGGVFERHPDLRFVLTEQGSGWVPATLEMLDFYMTRFRNAYGTNEAMIAGPVTAAVPLAPSEYWARNVWLGASFLRPRECALRDRIGVDRIMWGSDYPHTEGTFPFTREGLRLTFATVPPAETQAMLAANAAAVYGFDLDALAPIAARVGPTVAEVARPLDEMPAGATSPLFADEPLRPW